MPDNPFSNPYEPTIFGSNDFRSGIGNDVANAEAIRKKYLNHEASIQGVGSLYLLGGVIGPILGLFYTVSGLAILSGMSGASPNDAGSAGGGITLIALGLFTIAIGALQFYAGWTMRKLNPKGKILSVILAAFGLLGFPCGTLISVYILYLLLSAKGEYVYSPEYKAVIAATPHIKYRSILVWVVLGILLLIVAVAIIGAITGQNQ